MCGITGYYGVEETPLEAMVEALSHRGPDGAGYYRDAAVGLGSRRLAIVDRADGDQPVHNEDETVWAVFNGELFNHQELRDALREAGHRFYTGTDTEVIVHAYEEWGTACVDRFRGMFAIALWDAVNERLVLARDPIGKKPLYYRWDDGSLLFGSEMKAILAAESFEPTLDRDAARQFLAYGYTRHPETLFAEVDKLRPGEILTVEEGSVHREGSRSMDAISVPKSGDAAAARLRTLLEEEIQLWTREKGSYGVFLSGGVDSSAVTALLTMVDDIDVKAYTASFPGNRFDETRHAERVADHFGIDHQVIDIPQTGVDMLSDLVETFDDLMADQANVPYTALSSVAAEDGRVAFTGSGGDEVFGGYEHYRLMDVGDRFVRPIPARIRSVAPLAAKHTPARILSRFFPYAGDLGPAGISRFSTYLERLDAPSAAYEAMNAMMTTEEVDSLLQTGKDARSQDRITPSLTEDAHIPVMRQVMRYEKRWQLPNKNLMKTDKTGMRHGLELRSPLLTTATLQFSAGLPTSLLRRGGKQVFKRAMQPLVPEHTLRRRKQRLLAPIHEWMVQDGAWTVEELQDRYGLPPILDAAGMEQMVAGLQESPLYYARQLWNVANFVAWYDRYL